MSISVENSRILIVDDDENLLKVISMRTETAGYEVTALHSADEALKAAKETLFDLALVDLKLAECNGVELMERLHRINPELPVIILTAFGTIDSAVEATRKGAHSYITKPFDGQEMLRQIREVLEKTNLLRNVKRLGEISSEGDISRHIIGNSEKMLEVLKQVTQAAASESSVYIEGESGTGKELIARMVHAGSPRKEQSFVIINCAAIPETLWESELFGYKEGAFTGARTDRNGLLAHANNGTLFLDEISEMPLSIQTKMLRVLQEGEYYPIGGRSVDQVDARLIATSNKELKLEVDSGRFRQDLFYRINVIKIQVPPLRERSEDIPVLARFFLEKLMKKSDKPLKGFSPGALQKMMLYDWPGNVRELKNEVERAVVMATTDVITEEGILGSVECQEEHPKPLKQAKADFEKKYLHCLMGITHGNVTKASELSGKYRADFYELLRKHDLNPADFR